MRPVVMLFAVSCLRRFFWLGGTVFSVSRLGKVKIAIYFAFLMALISERAFAYIDPGSGGFILQAIIGALAAGSVALKIFWSRILSLFTKSKKKASAAVPAESPKEGP